MEFSSRKALAVAAVFALSPATAFAYIDPGTGSLLIQGIIAAVAAIGVSLRLYWHRLIGLFRPKAEDAESGTPDPKSGIAKSTLDAD